MVLLVFDQEEETREGCLYKSLSSFSVIIPIFFNHDKALFFTFPLPT